MSGGLAGFSPRVYTEWVPRKGAETRSGTHQSPTASKSVKDVLTGVYRQNHVWVILVSEESFSNEVLHLCDGRTALDTGSQKEA